MTEATLEQQTQTPHQTEVAKSPGNAAAAKPHPLLSVLLLFAVTLGSGSLALERKLIFTSFLPPNNCNRAAVPVTLVTWRSSLQQHHNSFVWEGL